ncbi:MAG: HEAT repeat domain-containing protein [Brevinematales bacterium]|nr:HEAT repeat domain-containing protein [Brevinematales bacterium]
MKGKWLVWVTALIMTGVLSGYGAHNVATDAIDPIDTIGPEGIPKLMEVAKSQDLDDMEIKIKAIQRLGKLKAVEAVPILIDALGYGSETIILQGGTKKEYPWKVRVVAALALAEIGSADAVEALVVRAFEDEEPTVKKAAVQALASLGPKAKTKKVLTYLFDMLEKTKDNSLAYDICIALGKIGDKSAFVHLLRVTQGGFLTVVKEKAEEAIKNLNWQEGSVFDK